MLKNNEFYTKKEELKKLFYTELTATQIKKELQITNNQYTKLLIEVKKDLGLPSDYRRLPKNFKLYGIDKYYIAEKTDDSFEIVEYSPTIEMVNQKLIEYENTNKDINYIVGQATKEEMLANIEDDYFNNELKWDMIMLKYKIPYHDFYELLNEVKCKRKVTGCRTASRLRYIVPMSRGVWLIRKTINGVKYDYGSFRNLELTIRLRDYLESIDWDMDTWNQNKEELIEGTVV